MRSMGSRAGSGVTSRGYSREEFFDVVRRNLADVPWSKRQKLLGHLVLRLDALPQRSRPEDVLGDPRAYARLIRESEGLSSERVRRFTYWRAMRLRNKVLVIAIPLLIALASVTNAYVQHYQPLTASQESGGPATAQPINDPLASGVEFYRYQAGATLVTGLDVTNTGWATVSVTGAAMGEASPLAVVGLRATTDPRFVADWHGASPVRSVAVHPGKTVVIFVMMRMKPYRLDRGSWVKVDQPPLTVQVVGVTHQLRPSGNQIGIVG
jgi:hypothetical protein